MRVLILITAGWLCLLIHPLLKAEEPSKPLDNQPPRLEWFQDQGLGLFFHWSVDTQLGTVISHSLVGSSDDYRQRYFTELPRTFNPTQYDPKAWARLAKACGFRYAVFNSKHHNGFCMYNTKTTDFGVMHTPCGRDLVKSFIEAFREQNLHPGLYFSPEDFWVLWKQGQEIARKRPHAMPSNNPELMKHNLAQVRELLSNYGPISMIFFDTFDLQPGRPDPLKSLCWELQPEIVVTRGHMETPEQHIPDKPMPGPWEANFTMGTQWNFKPTNEIYKTGGTLIAMLIETRAKGGNLLINVGPDQHGRIPHEQERRLMELGAWLFINGEAIYAIRPWHVIRENQLWFTKAKDDNTLYVFITGEENWGHGRRKDFVITSAAATEKTTIGVLGQNDQVVEYNPGIKPQSRFEQKDDGLHISVVRAQRIYNNRRWPNPLVVKLTDVQPVMDRTKKD